MLDDLEQVDWAGLGHAYGTAEDVPELLRALAGGDDEALTELHGTIWHQGTVYPATVPAVPFLIRVLEAPAAEPAGVLYLLAAIARGRGYQDAHVQDPVKRAEIQAEIDAELAQVAAAKDAVAAGLPVYLRLLSTAPDDTTRIAAATLIGVLGPDAGRGSSPALRAAIDGDAAILVRAAALLALGEHRETADEQLDDPDPMVRLAAALARAGSDAATPLPERVVTIIERDAPGSAELFNELSPMEDHSLTWVLTLLRPRWDLQVRLVAGWLRHPDAEVRQSAALAAQEPLLIWRPALELLVTPLAEALEDPDRSVRRWAGAQLAQAGPAAAPVADRLWAALQRHDDGSALVALCRSADARADAYLAGKLSAGSLDRLDKALDLLGPWATACRDVLAAALDAVPPGRDDLHDGLIRAATHTGVPAAELVPRLRRLIDGHPGPVCLALGELGPAAAGAVPELTALLAADNARTRFQAAPALWRITGDPAPALELLRAHGDGSDARKLIAELGPAAAEFTGALPPLFEATGYWDAIEAAVAWWRITGDAGPVVPVLLRCLECNPRGRLAVSCLAEIGPAAAAAAPRLREVVGSELRNSRDRRDHLLLNEEWRAGCAAALRRISGGH